MPFVRDGIESHRARNPLAEDEAVLRTSVPDTPGGSAGHKGAHMRVNVRLVGGGWAVQVGDSAGWAGGVHRGDPLLRQCMG